MSNREEHTPVQQMTVTEDALMAAREVMELAGFYSPPSETWDRAFKALVAAMPAPSQRTDLSDRIMRLLEDHDRCPPQARDYSRRRKTAVLMMQEITQANATPPPQTGLQGRIAELEAEIKRLKADRSYIIGCNEGFEEAINQAAAIAYRVCAETRHVTLGDKAASAIRALATAAEGRP